MPLELLKMRRSHIRPPKTFQTFCCLGLPCPSRIKTMVFHMHVNKQVHRRQSWLVLSVSAPPSTDFHLRRAFCIGLSVEASSDVLSPAIWTAFVSYFRFMSVLPPQVGYVHPGTPWPSGGQIATHLRNRCVFIGVRIGIYVSRKVPLLPFSALYRSGQEMGVRACSCSQEETT